VLGRTTVKDTAIRQKLIVALRKGVEENKERIMALCFDPRHAIRVTSKGKAVDCLVCFECYQMRVYVADEIVGNLPIFPSPEALLDAVLKDANVPLADKPKKEQASK
jgi:hypothetical protein